MARASYALTADNTSFIHRQSLTSNVYIPDTYYPLSLFFTILFRFLLPHKLFVFVSCGMYEKGIRGQAIRKSLRLKGAARICVTPMSCRLSLTIIQVFDQRKTEMEALSTTDIY